MGAAGGVFITTSRFTPDAVSFAKGINPRVILSTENDSVN